MFKKNKNDRYDYPDYEAYERKMRRGDMVDKGLEWTVYALATTAIGGVGFTLAQEIVNRPPAHYEGTVAAKDYDDPDTYTTVMSNGKTSTPIVHRDGEHWNLKIKTRDDEDGSYKTYNVEVKQRQYDKLAVGDKVHVDEGVITPENG